MLTAVYLHHKPPFRATKIDNIPADRVLTPELGAAHPAAP
jgi:hypothetical protein